MQRNAFDRARLAAVAKYRHLKAGGDKEEKDGMEAAQAQLGHSTSAMTTHYVRYSLGKMVKPTK